jgi:hypothetical protein
MAYPTSKLISNAYYLSGLVSRQLQTVTGSQVLDGLDLLNALISVKSANTRLIPYFQQFDFTAVVGQEKYFIPGLLAIETLTFNIGPIRYSMQPKKRIDYWGSSRVDNINSLPYDWNIQRCLGGSNIYVYFKPSQDFPMTAWGKFALPQVTLNQDLELLFDDYYIEYFRYALTEQICQDNNIEMQPGTVMRLKELESIIMYVDPPDLTNTNVMMYPRWNGLNYGIINIGRGWTT